MNRDELKKIYNEAILSHNKNPFHFEKKANCSKSFKAYNPMCGDKYQICLIENEERHHIQGFFHGFGCALSKASASILMEHVQDKAKEEIIEICKKFLNAFNEKDNTLLPSSELNILVQVKEFQARIDCVQLAWKAMLEALKK